MKKLDLEEAVFLKAANHLERMKEGSDEVYLTPFGKKGIPIELYVDWQFIVKANSHKLNSDLHELESSNADKFGPRSKSKTWDERLASFEQSYKTQNENNPSPFVQEPGDGTLSPVSFNEALAKSKLSSSAGLPFLTKKAKAIKALSEHFDEYLARKDAVMINTRTGEKGRTRNLWGYPFADTVFESMFSIPYQELERTFYWRAAIVSPDLVDQRITEIIDKAMATMRFIYSVDFAGFDVSIRYQYIIKAFNDIQTAFADEFHKYVDYICERFYTIKALTPRKLFVGKHAVPSGATLTLTINSGVQKGIALLNDFINILEAQIQGDDGVYIVPKDRIEDFENTWKRAGLILEKSKSKISHNSAVFCQRLYHDDYRDAKGFIGGIYPTYRALNRLIFQEKFVNFNVLGMSGKDYYAIRTLTILENCKYHPLFEELVRFVYAREKFHLDISEDGLQRYINISKTDTNFISQVNSQYGSNVVGIRNFECYKLIQKIAAKEAQEENI